MGGSGKGLTKTPNLAKYGHSEIKLHIDYVSTPKVPH